MVEVDPSLQFLDLLTKHLRLLIFLKRDVSLRVSNLVRRVSRYADRSQSVECSTLGIPNLSTPLCYSERDPLDIPLSIGSASATLNRRLLRPFNPFRAPP